MMKEGDKVIISLYGKSRYRDRENNPYNLEGTLLDVECGVYCYYVDWGNGFYNSYRKDELELSSPCLENK